MKKLFTLLIALFMLLLPICPMAETSDSTQSDSPHKIDISMSDLNDVLDALVSDDASYSDDSDNLVGGNIVVDGEFNHGDSFWRYFAYNKDDGSLIEAATDDARGDCLHVHAPKSNDVRAQQEVSVNPNTYYEISALVKTENVTGGNGVSVSIDGIIGAYSDALLGDNDWTRLTMYGLTASDQTSMTVSLRIGGYSAESQGDAWFDDVYVKQVDTKPDKFITLYSTSTDNDNDDNSSNNDEENTSSDEKKISGIVPLCGVAIIILLVAYFVITKKPKKKTFVSTENVLLKRTDTKLHFTRKDTILICSLTLIYAVVALTHLGTTQAPSTEWTGSVGSEAATITFDGETKINKIYIFGAVLGGVREGGTVTITDADGNDICTYEQIYRDMYRWREVSNKSITTSSVTITPTGSQVNFKEIAFFDADGNHIFGKAIGNAQTLVDEPDQIPDEFSCMNGMYFDELYHGRTAYEHLNFLESYENSHPPLGKLIISIGIALFGMNAFGWRVMGTLFGIGMVPIFYCFAKRILKNTNYAFVAAVLFAFDFMHFTQTRIATIDVYGLFFILLMFYFMYKYFTMSFFRDGLARTFIPLGLAGIFFGLGAASKWICFYAGGGLAIMLLISFIQRFMEYRKYSRSTDDGYKKAVSHFWRNIILTVVFCVGFFIVIPVIIYCLSYIRYPDVVEAFKTEGLKGYLGRVWHYQDFMFSYHSKLEATHPFQSTWYQWMIDARPIWYSISYFPNNNVATISAMGNPIVWWLSLAGTIGLIIQVARRKINLDAPVIMIFIGILSNLLPWMVITRCAFIYHYFATVPFILFAAIYLLQSLEAEHKWLSYFKWTWMGVALALFALFYPVIAGIKIPESYALSLEWMRSWWFVRSADAPDNTGIILGVIIIQFIKALFVGLGLYSFFKQRSENNKLKLKGGKQ